MSSRLTAVAASWKARQPVNTESRQLFSGSTPTRNPEDDKQCQIPNSGPKIMLISSLLEIGVAKFCWSVVDRNPPACTTKANVQAMQNKRDGRNTLQRKPSARKTLRTKWCHRGSVVLRPAAAFRAAQSPLPPPVAVYPLTTRTCLEPKHQP